MDFSIEAILKAGEELEPISTQGVRVDGEVVCHGSVDTFSLTICRRMIGSGGMCFDMEVVHDGLGDVGSELCAIVCDKMRKWAKFEDPMVNNGMGNLRGFLGLEGNQNSVFG